MNNNAHVPLHFASKGHFICFKSEHFNKPIMYCVRFKMQFKCLLFINLYWHLRKEVRVYVHFLTTLMNHQNTNTAYVKLFIRDLPFIQGIKLISNHFWHFNTDFCNKIDILSLQPLNGYATKIEITNFSGFGYRKNLFSFCLNRSLAGRWQIIV